MNIFSYEHSISLWENIFREKIVRSYNKFDPEMFTEYTDQQCCILIDSINQMALNLGWYKCLKYIKMLKNNQNVKKLIVVLHKDCLQYSSKLQKHLNHIANAIVSFNDNDSCKITVQLKLGNKLIKTEEILCFDQLTSVLKSEKVIKEIAKEEEPVKPTPDSLSTFKIEVDQTQKLEKYKLKLPYMSKINEGQSKVYYEPDAVDDWDDEDPDDDLDI
ncbi:unnamed protein product [Parnassius apollo]|uniref:Elongator complex protein 5 n=1 Tax=Parnassius apollo TaxID=110799 RepID=A0A8S3XX85_PARAO|nr:unnamed protein product [Parnassius apollo]